MTRFAWFLLIAACVQFNPNQPSVDLPKPSGPFHVGRITYDWVDSSRSETLSRVPNTPREILVDVWYPAAPPKPGARTAPYLPDADRIEKSSFAKFEEHWWRKAWPTVVSGGFHTHVYANAPIVPGDTRFPLIIFSPGYSVEPAGYTNQIEDLVSHGYVVATIHHTYEVAVVMFPDGRMVPFSVENSRGQDAPTIEEYARWEKARVDVWAADIRFTLDNIARLNKGSRQKDPFAGRIAIQQVGVVGHSFGGLAAARACSLDHRLMACVNQDGVGLDGSIPHYGEGHMPTHPYMYMTAFVPPPKNQDGKEQRAQMEKEFQDCAGGAYEVSIETPGFEHMGFADFSSLKAAGNAEESLKALRSLRVVEMYTNAFFDKFLKKKPNTLLDVEPSDDSEVKISRYSL
jgi:Platelet-activating factor acetylhydrolase, isoform II